MKKLLRFVVALAILLSLPVFASADPLVLASGAGYKKLVNKLVKIYTEKSGDKVDLIYGNMARVTAQAKISGKVDLVLGADWFLARSGIDFAELHRLGQGRLVVAWSAGNNFESYRDMQADSVKRIAMPDSKRAIYGKAALEYLKSTGLYSKVKDKLVEVATIPQVSSYVIANEVDMGFINMTHAQQIKDKLAGYAPAEEDKYAEITIQVGKLSGAVNSEAADRFISFLETGEAGKMIKAHGL